LRVQKTGTHCPVRYRKVPILVVAPHKERVAMDYIHIYVSITTEEFHLDVVIETEPP
jgi:hypothetical protein